MMSGHHNAGPDLPDAVAPFSQGPPPPGASGRGLLLTADGQRYEGLLFGAEGHGEGELVFTTGMMGYQESLTDPSFAGQVLTFISNSVNIFLFLRLTILYLALVA